MMVPARLFKATVLWFAILLLAMLNGGFREAVLIPVFGSFRGFILSGIILSGCIFLVAYLAAPWYGTAPSPSYWTIGIYWLVLTIIFEFGFGRFIAQKPWSELLGQYTFQGGNVWPLVLVVVVVSPWLAAKLRGLL